MTTIDTSPDTPFDPMSDRTEVAPQVVADLRQRVETGAQEYGEPLTTHNGRNALQDAYEEALDLALYLKQEMIEDMSKVRKEHGYACRDIHPAILVERHTGGSHISIKVDDIYHEELMDLDVETAKALRDCLDAALSDPAWTNK